MQSCYIRNLKGKDEKRTTRVTQGKKRSIVRNIMKVTHTLKFINKTHNEQSKNNTDEIHRALHCEKK